jgi:phosphoserine phosphatase RsbU/P
VSDGSGPERPTTPSIPWSGQPPCPGQGGDSGRPGLDAFAGMALFAGVPVDTLQPLLEQTEILALGAGDVLLVPGQPNHNLYLLLQGHLKVHIDRVDSEEGFLIPPGECVGEISIIDGKPATAFVVAEEPAQVLVLPEARFWEEFLSIPVIAKNFMRLFANRFRAGNQAVQRALEQELRHQHLHKELAIARDIQMGMLPRDLDFGPELDIAAEMTAALQVGGDFYDVFPVGSDACCLVVADISGKGVPAALFMVRTMALLRAELLKDQPLEEALRRLNALLCEDNPTCMFATLAVAMVSRLTGDCHYVNAGHDPMILGERGVGFQPLPVPRGVLVGVDERATYEVASIKLAVGDVLLLYTDGVTEAMNHDGELFTKARLLGCLERAPAASAADVADRVNRAVQQFTAGAPRSDDLTMVILRYLGPGASG